MDYERGKRVGIPENASNEPPVGYQALVDFPGSCSGSYAEALHPMGNGGE